MLEEYRVKDIDALKPGMEIGINLLDLWKEKTGIPLPPLVISEEYEPDNFELPVGMTDDVWIDDNVFMRACYAISMHVGNGWSLKIELLGVRPDDGKEEILCSVDQDCGMEGACEIVSVDEDKIIFMGETWDGRIWWTLSREHAEKFLHFPTDEVYNLYRRAHFEVDGIETS